MKYRLVVNPNKECYIEFRDIEYGDIFRTLDEPDNVCMKTYDFYGSMLKASDGKFNAISLVDGDERYVEPDEPVEVYIGEIEFLECEFSRGDLN